MAIKVITAPVEILTLAEVRLHLKDPATEDDALIASQLLAAHAYAEHYTGCAIGVQTLEMALDAFPDGAIAIERAPLVSVDSISYLDSAGVVQTVPSTDYAIDDYGMSAWIVPAYQTDWPETLDAVNAVKVRYVAGDVKPAVRAALLLIVGHLYANRESVSPGNLAVVPMGANALLDTVKTYA